jgi:hypothetical protein
MVAVGGPIADIMEVHFYQAALLGALQDACFKIGSENFGEERKDVEAHACILSHFALT